MDGDVEDFPADRIGPGGNAHDAAHAGPVTSPVRGRRRTYRRRFPSLKSIRIAQQTHSLTFLSDSQCSHRGGMEIVRAGKRHSMKNNPPL
jgi:hypothetical protein